MNLFGFVVDSSQCIFFPPKFDVLRVRASIWFIGELVMELELFGMNKCYILCIQLSCVFLVITWFLVCFLHPWLLLLVTWKAKSCCGGWWPCLNKDFFCCISFYNKLIIVLIPLDIFTFEKGLNYNFFNYLPMICWHVIRRVWFPKQWFDSQFFFNDSEIHVGW